MGKPLHARGLTAPSRIDAPGGRAAPTSIARHAHERLGAGSPLDRAAMRALDIGVALGMLIAALPLLAAIALAIVIDSPGRVFHRVDRVGRHGRPLRMLKFRKMAPGAAGPPLTVDRDARLTRIGGWLARARLDELPQLWQVVRGEMSLVGPRPEDPVFVAERADDYAAILAVRPGLTGFAQLAYADERRILSPSDPVGDYLARVLPQKCALDKLYIARASVGTNLRVLGWTLVAMLARRPVAVDRRTGAMRVRRRPGGQARPSASSTEPTTS
jgi:lipopolysaccharide/colanic/teichoic acid biosynthesis glycosyltransferase